ncbi:hypothetical protein L3Y34_000496 [Caenorhabditis briggsae]|uniref:Uncharacterized protein n=1 Tax=Caenorhabditis briggsae TaxID=6238 RepID=A0AAE9INQ0_CAEBR|nr:hypothetical protein L3Y34_000496 [Caenorhabditis briggsae]
MIVRTHNALTLSHQYTHMSSMQSTPPNKLKQCGSDVNRVLYIQLAGNYNNAQRTRIRGALYRRIVQQQWNSLNSQTGFLFHKRDDRASYADLAEEIRNVIRNMPTTLKCGENRFPVAAEDFQFTFLKPMYAGDVTVEFDGFDRLLSQQSTDHETNPNEDEEDEE